MGRGNNSALDVSGHDAGVLLFRDAERLVLQAHRKRYNGATPPKVSRALSLLHDTEWVIISGSNNIIGTVKHTSRKVTLVADMEEF